MNVRALFLNMERGETHWLFDLLLNVGIPQNRMRFLYSEVTEKHGLAVYREPWANRMKG